MSDKHDVLADFKQLASDLGHVPTRDEYLAKGGYSERQVRNHFGGFTQLTQAAGLAPQKSDKEKFKYKKSLLESYKIHNLPIRDLFRKAGDVETLRVIAQPDTHVAHRDKGAWQAFIEFIEFYQPDVHIIMGDFLDAEGLSHWPSDDLKPRRIVPEIIEARSILEEIVTKTPDCSTRIYLEGNHEDWIRQFLVSGPNPQLFDELPELGLEISLKTLLGLDKLGYKLYPLNHIVRLGKANFTHGLYTGDAHAKKHLTKLKGNIYYGHLHDTQSYNDTSMDGPMEAHSLGCLCKLDPKYMKGKPTNWAHAFGIFEFFKDGSYTFYCPKIIGGKMAFAGRIFGLNQRYQGVPSGSCDAVDLMG